MTDLLVFVGFLLLVVLVFMAVVALVRNPVFLLVGAAAAVSVLGIRRIRRSRP